MQNFPPIMAEEDVAVKAKLGTSQKAFNRSGGDSNEV